MTKRVSAVLRDDDLVEWLESREESQAATIREGLRELRAREGGSPMDHAVDHSGSEMDHGGSPVDQSDPAVDHERDDLRARVADLEDRVDGLEADGDGGEQDDRADAPGLDVLVQEWMPGKTEQQRAERRRVGRAALEWLRERGGRASGSDFQAVRGDAIPDVAGQNEETWWRNSVRPLLQLAADHGLVEYRVGHHDYQWIGEE